MNIIKYLIDILTILCIAALFFAVWLNSSWFFYAKDHLRFNEYNDYKIYKATKGINVVYIAKIRYFKLFWRFKLYTWYTSTGENIRRKCIESSYIEGLKEYLQQSYELSRSCYEEEKIEEVNEDEL